MPLEVPKRSLDQYLESSFPPQRKKAFVIEPMLSGEEATRLEIRRVALRIPPNGLMQFAPGEYPGFSIARASEIIVPDVGQATIVDTLLSSAPNIRIQGIKLSPRGNSPALEVTAGTMVCNDVEIQGPILVRAGARLFLNNCSVRGREGTALTLEEDATAEISASIISGWDCALSSASGKIQLFNSLFDSCGGEERPAALIGAGGLAAAGLRAYSSVGEWIIHGNCHLLRCLWRQTTGHAIHFSPTNPSTELHAAECSLESDQDAALCISTGKVHLDRCHVTSTESPAIEITSGRAALKSCQIESSSVPAIAGDPSRFELTDGQAEDNPSAGGREPGHPLHSPIVSALQKLSSPFLRKRTVEELKRVVSVNWAFRQKCETQSAVPSETPGVTLLGQPHSGQDEATALLSSALADIGVIDRTTPVCHPAEHLGNNSAEMVPALHVVQAMHSEHDPFNSAHFGDALLNFATRLPANSALVLSGNPDQVHALFRKFPALKKHLPHQVVFPDLVPEQLVLLFEKLCQDHGIQFSAGASRRLVVLIYTLFGGFGRRVVDTETVNELFHEVHANFLLRISEDPTGRQMLTSADLDVPLHRMAEVILTRSPDLNLVCQECGDSSPWIPELTIPATCPSCGTPFSSKWGSLRNPFNLGSASGTLPTGKSGAVALKTLRSPG